MQLMYPKCLSLQIPNASSNTGSETPSIMADDIDLNHPFSAITASCSRSHVSCDTDLPTFETVVTSSSEHYQCPSPEQSLPSIDVDKPESHMSTYTADAHPYVAPTKVKSMSKRTSGCHTIDNSVTTSENTARQEFYNTVAKSLSTTNPPTVMDRFEHFGSHMASCVRVLEPWRQQL